MGFCGPPAQKTVLKTTEGLCSSPRVVGASCLAAERVYCPWKQCQKYVVQLVCGLRMLMLLLIHQSDTEKSRVIAYKEPKQNVENNEKYRLQPPSALSILQYLIFIVCFVLLPFPVNSVVAPFSTFSGSASLFCQTINIR